MGRIAVSLPYDIDDDLQNIRSFAARLFPNPPVGSYHFQEEKQATFLDTTQTKATFRNSIQLMRAVKSIQMAFVGIHGVAGGTGLDNDNENNFLLSCGMEDPVTPNTVIAPCLFGSRKQTQVRPGQVVINDIYKFPANVAKGVRLWYRPWVQLPGTAATWKVPYASLSRPGIVAGSGGAAYDYNAGVNGGSGFTYNADLWDVGSGAVTTQAFVFTYSPLWFMGELVTPEPNIPYVVYVGDSIISAQGDAHCLGFPSRTMQRHDFPYARLGSAGETLQNFLNVGNSNKKLRLCIWAYAGTIPGGAVVHEHNVNDFSTIPVNSFTNADQLINRMRTVWNMSRQFGIRRIGQTTMWPYSPTADGSVASANLVYMNYVNDYIRTMPYPLNFVWDVSDAVSTGRNTGIWKTGYTSQNPHPLAAACEACADWFDANGGPQWVVSDVSRFGNF